MENKGAKDYFVEMCKENNKRYFVSMFVRKLRQGIVKNVIEEHPLLEKKIEKKFLSNKPLDLNQNIEIFINLVIIL